MLIEGAILTVKGIGVDILSVLLIKILLLASAEVIVKVISWTGISVISGEQAVSRASKRIVSSLMFLPQIIKLFSQYRK